MSTRDAHPRAFTLPEGDAAGAFERMRARIDAVQDGALAPLNVHPLTACNVVFASLARIVPHVAELRGIPQLEHGAVDDLESLALALWWAHALVPATERDAQPQRIACEAARTRRELLAFVRALIAFEIVPADALASLSTGRGYRRIATDLGLLVGVLRLHAAEIAARAPTGCPDLARAEGLAAALIAATTRRHHRPFRSAEERDASLTRRRAFTLLDRAYSEVRRGVTLLRWHDGDADAIVPPMRGGTSNR